MPEPGVPGRDRLRGEARDEQLRARLEPLAPGERPTAITVAAVVALLLGAGNAIGAVVGEAADRPLLIGLAVFALVVAGGLLRTQDWAAMIALAASAVTAVWAFLSLLVADNVGAAAVSIVVLAASGVLFWSLIRPLGRMQAPPRE